MGFASAWLNERALFPAFINEAPGRETGIIVVVPAFDEPDISDLLDSLVKCDEPACMTEVIIVINAPSDADSEHIKGNTNTQNNIESWKKQHTDCFFRLFSFIVNTADFSKWGVGLARKTGMDEAVRRFSDIGNPDGIIVSLDADCHVESNYFSSLYNDFFCIKELKACSIYFEHPLEGMGFSDSVYRYISLYELHLRYYVRGLIYAGFPDASHTVGSSMAVRAFQYIRAGGMNRKQAGEDFYFIQKLAGAGGYFNLNSTTVYPSPRISSRVPFGTGASIGKLASVNDNVLLSYNILAFEELKSLFSLPDKLFSMNTEDTVTLYAVLPEGIRYFMDEAEWSSRITEIRNNTSSQDSFRKRFFGWFNMFQIVKYMNHVHNGFFNKMPVQISASQLLTVMDFSNFSVELQDLLVFYRSIEKGS